jgi:lipoate-protein ligase A
LLLFSNDLLLFLACFENVFIYAFIIHLILSSLSLLYLFFSQKLLRSDPLQRNWVIVNQPARDYQGIVMGISGKPELLVNVDKVKADRIPIIKRFTGGGTVYVDQNTLFVSLIINDNTLSEVKMFPREIMKWSHLFYQDIFHEYTSNNMQSAADNSSTNILSQSQSISASSSSIHASTLISSAMSNPPLSTDMNTQQSNHQLQNSSPFLLNEHDYCFGVKKVGGNAQSIIRGRFLHHTSFLCDFDSSKMSDYLQLPAKRPEYRQDRNHKDFLCTLRDLYTVVDPVLTPYTPTHSQSASCGASASVQANTDTRFHSNTVTSGTVNQTTSLPSFHFPSRLHNALQSRFAVQVEHWHSPELQSILTASNVNSSQRITDF